MRYLVFDKKEQYYNTMCYKNFIMERQINYKIQQHDCHPKEMDKELLACWESDNCSWPVYGILDYDECT